MEVGGNQEGFSRGFRIFLVFFSGYLLAGLG